MDLEIRGGGIEVRCDGMGTDRDGDVEKGGGLCRLDYVLLNCTILYCAVLYVL